MKAGDNFGVTDLSQLHGLAHARKILRGVGEDNIAISQAIESFSLCFTQEWKRVRRDVGVPTRMNVPVVQIPHSSIWEQFRAGIHTIPKERNMVTQAPHFPLVPEAGQASLAGEKLLHDGLLEVALLGDEPTTNNLA